MFKKYFDPTHRTPQPDYFVNNANAALVASVWDENRFDESITGLEDMHLARRLISKGMKISYAPGAAVYHIHDESWMQVKWRYEREALALQAIDSSLHMSRRDLVSCILRSVYFDSLEAVRRGVFWATAAEIVAFRVCQYWGSYLGSRGSRKLNEAMKRRYFYPDKK